MPVTHDPSRITFQRLERQLTKLAARPIPENVHKFRTSGRRVEALLSELIDKPGRNEKKLQKLLAKLRRKAGRVRDLDVQILSLRNLRMPEEPGRKAQLLRALSETRALRENKLAESFDKQTLRELRRRLKRAASRIETPKNTELMAIAMRKFSRSAREETPPTEDTLHKYRVAGKRARYLAELVAKDSEAVYAVEQLKRMQDVIGDWHDWWKLTRNAEKVFDGTPKSALVSALQNVTRHKFTQAVDTLVATKAALAKKAVPASVSISTPGRRPPVRQSSDGRVAAAS